jgi:hypothetical protein
MQLCNGTRILEKMTAPNLTMQLLHFDVEIVLRNHRE